MADTANYKELLSRIVGISPIRTELVGVDCVQVWFHIDGATGEHHALVNANLIGSNHYGERRMLQGIFDEAALRILGLREFERIHGFDPTAQWRGGGADD